MAQTYSASNLAAVLPSNLAWARDMVRLLIRDKPNTNNVFPVGGLTNEEIEALLLIDSMKDSITLGGDDTIYYLPHATAASNIITALKLRYQTNKLFL